MKRLNDIRSLIAGLWLLLLTGLPAVSVALENYVVIEGDGELQEMQLDENRIIVSGLDYRLAPDVNVTIAGTYGAPTMLQVGMKLELVYREYSGSDRELTEIHQLPPDTEVAQF